MSSVNTTWATEADPNTEQLSINDKTGTAGETPPPPTASGNKTKSGENEHPKTVSS